MRIRGKRDKLKRENHWGGRGGLESILKTAAGFDDRRKISKGNSFIRNGTRDRGETSACHEGSTYRKQLVVNREKKKGHREK